MEDRENEPIPRDQIGAELHTFFKHVKSHDPTFVRAALCLVVNEDKDDENSAHVCAFAGGETETIAKLLAEAVVKMAPNPGFMEAFSLNMKKAAIEQVVEKVVKHKQESADNAEKADDIAQTLFAKLKGKLK